MERWKVWGWGAHKLHSGSSLCLSGCVSLGWSRTLSRPNCILLERSSLDLQGLSHVPTLRLCASHHLVGVTTMLSPPGSSAATLWISASAGCWTPNQRCVRMGKGWNLVCWAVRGSSGGTRRPHWGKSKGEMDHRQCQPHKALSQWP